MLLFCYTWRTNDDCCIAGHSRQNKAMILGYRGNDKNFQLKNSWSWEVDTSLLPALCCEQCQMFLYNLQVMYGITRRWIYTRLSQFYIRNKLGLNLQRLVLHVHAKLGLYRYQMRWMAENNPKPCCKIQVCTADICFRSLNIIDSHVITF